MLSFIRVSLSSLLVPINASQQFTATALDQFGDAMSAQGPFSWSCTGGTIDATGLYSSGATIGGPQSVVVSSGGVAGSAVFTLTYPNGPGVGITRQWWNGIPGANVSDLTGNANFPNNPSGTSIIPAAGGCFEAPSNFGDNYGQRLYGYFIAPVTGNYTFYIASDESSALYLSTDSNPDHKSVIASVNGATAARQWDKYPSQKSAPIALLANQYYYIEALHKEATGADNLSVGVDLPGGISELPIPGDRLQPFGLLTIQGAGNDTIRLGGDAANASMLDVFINNTSGVPDYQNVPAGAPAGAGARRRRKRHAHRRLFAGQRLPVRGRVLRRRARLESTPGDWNRWQRRFCASATTVSVGGATISYVGVSSIAVNGRAGDDTLTIASQLPFSPIFKGVGHDTLAINGGQYDVPTGLATDVPDLSLQVNGSAIAAVLVAAIGVARHRRQRACVAGERGRQHAARR